VRLVAVNAWMATSWKGTACGVRAFAKRMIEPVEDFRDGEFPAHQARSGPVDPNQVVVISELG